MITSILKYLSGKKSTIATIVGAFLIFALGREWIVQDTAEFISIVMVALGYTASRATKAVYNK